MVHKSKEAIKKGDERARCTSVRRSLVPVLRIRRVEHAIKIPIAVCPPTRRHSGSREEGGEAGRSRARQVVGFAIVS